MLTVVVRPVDGLVGIKSQGRLASLIQHTPYRNRTTFLAILESLGILIDRLYTHGSACRKVLEELRLGIGRSGKVVQYRTELVLLHIRQRIPSTNQRVRRLIDRRLGHRTSLIVTHIKQTIAIFIVHIATIRITCINRIDTRDDLGEKEQVQRIHLSTRIVGRIIRDTTGERHVTSHIQPVVDLCIDIQTRRKTFEFGTCRIRRIGQITQRQIVARIFTATGYRSGVFLTESTVAQ